MAEKKDSSNKLTKKQKKIVDYLSSEEQDGITFSHSTLCQTSLPFKDMGDLRRWKSQNGKTIVIVEAGIIFDSKINQEVELKLPCGSRARLPLLYFNQRALQTRSPIIEVEKSFSAFLSRIGVNNDGYNYRAVKEQLKRLAASQIIIGRFSGTEEEPISTTEYSRVVNKIELLVDYALGKNAKWPKTITLSQSYFDSLINHAVPLSEQAVGCLANSALELDLYSMLAERLHRIPENSTQFIPWAYLWDQYGTGYTRIRKFRDKFLEALKNVQGVYEAARVEPEYSKTDQPSGLRLYPSRPPISYR